MTKIFGKIKNQKKQNKYGDKVNPSLNKLVFIILPDKRIKLLD